MDFQILFFLMQSKSDSTWVSVSSASGTHHGMDAGNAQVMASSKYIIASSLLTTT